MRITLDLYCSSATLKAALAELRRQKAAMEERYPGMMERGKISGAEAERRLFAHDVAVQAIDDLWQKVRDAELEATPPTPDDEDE